MNLFYSSIMSKKKTIDEVFKYFIEKNISNIELTGGIQYDKNINDKLVSYKNKYNFNLLIHNYFPCPKNEFVINLSSLDKEVYDLSLQHCKNSIEVSKRINSKKYAFHAGFLTDINVEETGNLIKRKKLANRNNAIERFCEAFTKLFSFSAGEVDLFVENNIITQENYKNFLNVNPFLLTDKKSYEELKSFIDFNILIDLGHLNVSSETLNLDIDDEANFFLEIAKYIHFSENNKIADENLAFSSNNNAYRHLSKNKLDNKIITLEIKSDFNHIKKVRDKILEL